MTADPGLAPAVRTIVALMAPLPPASAEHLNPESRLIADLGFHSLALLELGAAMEEVFATGSLSARLAGQVERVGDVEELLSRAVAQKEARVPSPSEVASFVADYRADLEC